MSKIIEKKPDEFVRIESIVTDQGNGSSYCSACETSFDIFNLHKREGEFYPRCPGCERQLSFGGIFTSPGGSDF